MSVVTYNANPSHRANAVLAEALPKNSFNDIASRIKDVAESPIAQAAIGFGLGAVMHKVYGPLTEKIVKALGVTTILSDPFAGFSRGTQVLLAPLICVISPIMEEVQFRGDLQGALKDKFESFCINRGFSNTVANTIARVASVFFTSIIFGLVHFSNAILFWCNPILFLPQVVAATFMGLMLGLAKEFSGTLLMPIGMHISNNSLAWAQYMKATP